MSRIGGHVFSQSQFPVGRLVYLKGEYDAGEKTIEFLVPSGSRADRVYAVVVDCISGEVSCAKELDEHGQIVQACEDWAYRVHTKAGRLSYGVYLEQQAKAIKNITMLPSITRNPSGLCPHCRKVRTWLKRHGIYQHLETVVSVLEARLDDMQKKKAA